MPRTLYGLAQSPWTERARWALDHHGLTYAYHEHVPFLGEPLLRRKAGVAKATVPLLDDDGIVMGSVEIGRHADRVGRGAMLFPVADDTRIAEACALADRMARVGRAWVLSRLLASRDALAESLPPFVPAPLRRLAAPTTVLALRFLMKKHAVPTDLEREVRETLRPALLEARAMIGDGPFVTSSFTFADVALAAQMHALRPRPEAPLGPATREAWTNEPLATEFSDLLAWRDTVYDAQRARP